MEILTTGVLRDRFEHLLKTALWIDISVAWVSGKQAATLCHYVKQRKIPLRLMTGLYGNSTQPAALKQLRQVADVKAGECAGVGIFHTKLYIFGLPNKRVVWIGSANLTDAGFSENEELVHQTIDDTGSASQWFESRWGSIDAFLSDQVLDQYIKKWTKPKWPPRKKTQNTAFKTINNNPLSSLDISWKDYLRAIEVRNNHWLKTAGFSVTGKINSWDETLCEGSRIISIPDWSKLTQEEVDILLGLKEKVGKWALLGQMRRASDVVKWFSKPSPANFLKREAIRKAIIATLAANNTQSYLQIVETSLNSMLAIDGVGLGVATRLLTLARPDMATSVNNGSAELLTKYSKIKLPNTRGTRHYLKVLNWVYGLSWYNSPRPIKPTEALIWDKRAALVDSFVYKYGS